MKSTSPNSRARTSFTSYFSYYFQLLVAIGMLVAIPELTKSSPLHPHDHYPNDVVRAEVVQMFEPRLAPFYHGVASGDPLTDRVILWTRVTPETDGNVRVKWHLYRDLDLTDKVTWGSYITNQEKDYTVKIDATGLEPNTTYYYAFEYEGQWSLTGRTRTLPENADEVKLAIVSCVNYQWGYFNALERISERNDLNAVIHLGDYFYEYPPGSFGHPDLELSRMHEPASEAYKLADYRIRFSQYRLDPMLRKVHQQHPMIAVWDDHESTNNAWSTGASNHTENEGSWEDRKDFSAKAYSEWMPIRLPDSEVNTQIYRSFDFGGMLEIFMLETRLSARDEPVGSGTSEDAIDTLDWQRNDRTMLGDTQKEWLLNSLSNSRAKWKVMGSSVMMTNLPVNLLLNFDAWDGYPAERNSIFDFIESNGISNIGAFSGDVHMSFASNLVDSYTNNTEVYDSVGGAGAIGFEFTTPSITSSNLNELPELELPFFGTIDPLGQRMEERSQFATLIESIVKGQVPWVNHYNSDQHGYFLFYANVNFAQADWWYTGSVLQPNTSESLGASIRVRDGDKTLVRVDEPIEYLGGSQLATDDVVSSTGLISMDGQKESRALLIGNYPNPAKGSVYINLVLNSPERITINLYDITGSPVLSHNYGVKPSGNHVLSLDISSLSAGSYRYTVGLRNEGDTGNIPSRTILVVE